MALASVSGRRSWCRIDAIRCTWWRFVHFCQVRNDSSYLIAFWIVYVSSSALSGVLVL